MDLSNIYSLRQKFTIIAITGRTGSGCTEVAQRLVKGFENNEEIFPNPDEFEINHNTYRKYRIVYKYAIENFKPFKIINYKDLLIAFILKYNFNEFISFLNSDALKKEFSDSKLETSSDFSSEIKRLNKEKKLFSDLHKIAKKIINDSKKNENQLKELYIFFESSEFKKISEYINSSLESISLIKRNKTLQIISNNLRGYGLPYNNGIYSPNNIFTIAEIINDLIKAIRKNNYKGNTEIVIDSLRNPIEIMFFKQRYAAFYTLAINRDDPKRSRVINNRYKKNKEDIEILLKEEYSVEESAEFYKQNVSSCIQNADIHITYRTRKEAQLFNKYRILKKQNTSPAFSWGMQLLKFIALIDHPGIVTPSPEERCMQLAYTAKYNSGCISRQVGAAITDENFSIKAIGWNSTPEGHVPCSLRNAEDLINNEKDLTAFTPFEKDDKKFRDVLLKNYKVPIQDYKVQLKGQNVCFCFKSLINSYLEGKNQVHTRSLHAEESAFLQLTKYGSTGIQNGILFTTASPCELCSKKAYQLGIKSIYYIDPYPGISKSQILYAGRKDRNPKIKLFNGAIGNAYHWLYEPFMPYKDELSLILELNIKDLTSNLKTEKKELEKDIKDLKLRISQLESEVKELTPLE